MKYSTHKHIAWVFTSLLLIVIALCKKLNIWLDRFTDFFCVAFTVSNVDFVIKIQDLKAPERDNALFVCVLTHPLPKITWMGKGSALEDGEKYSITVSDHKLIHQLLIRDCNQLDKGIYSAVAGITSCSAWLVVQGNTLQYNVPVTNLSMCAEVILISAIIMSDDFHK